MPILEVVTLQPLHSMYKKINVLFITEDFYPEFIGGQGVYGYHLVSGLKKLGCEVTVLAENRVGRESFWKNRKNIKVTLVPFCFGNQLLLAFLEYLFFILRYKNTYFDILHANQLSALFFILFKPKNVGKIVISIHNTNYDLAKVTNSRIKWFLYQLLIWIERIIYTKADALLFHSEFEKRVSLNYYRIKNKAVSLVLMGATNLSFTAKEKFQASQKLKKDLDVDWDSKIILSIARLVKRKKIETFLKALNILKLQNLNVVGIIIGQGRDLQRLKRLAPANVYFLGSSNDPTNYYLASDLFVLTSVAEGGLSLAAIQALNFSLPLIVSPDIAESIVLDGKNGYIVDPDDSKQLADRIKMVLEKSTKMGRISRKMATKFSWELTARKTLNFYQSLIEKP